MGFDPNTGVPPCTKSLVTTPFLESVEAVRVNELCEPLDCCKWTKNLHLFQASAYAPSASAWIGSSERLYWATDLFLYWEGRQWTARYERNGSWSQESCSEPKTYVGQWSYQWAQVYPAGADVVVVPACP